MTLIASIKDDIRRIRDYDPSMTSDLQVLLTSAGAHAVWAYRLSHRAWERNHRLLAQTIRYVARMVTGVELHPASSIGRGLVIDHGTGIVVGETAVIGDDVVLHHQVTLGGRTNKPGKRHPTLEDRVFVGAGVMILGDIVVGADSRVGAATVVLESVPASSTVVGNPARVVRREASS